MTQNTPHTHSGPVALELLAPARDAATAMAAIDHGADAVYIGGPAFGARAAAGNSIDDLRRVADYAHRYRARVYVTFNTIIYENELEEARRMVYDLYGAGIDALIVQDMALLMMDLPPIALHASTQCDTRTPERARFLQDVGFSQIVPARELSLDEIRRLTAAVDVPVEVFVHGALCVSYSGDCHASALTTGRSANRGNCAQMCRLAYDLTDADGRTVAPRRHYLSLKDMNRLDRLGELIEAGVRSFKIEGRLKDASYVKETVSAYSKVLDSFIAARPGEYCRVSKGTVARTFAPDVNKAFNRGFTPYFLDNRPRRAERGMAMFETPKWIGLPVGTVTGGDARCGWIAVDCREGVELHNGDGLGYHKADGTFAGFRVNRVEGRRIFPAQPLSLPAGTELYRNRDKERDDMLGGITAKRTLRVEFGLRRSPDGIVLSVSDERGLTAEVHTQCGLTEARTPQLQQRIDLLSKLGDTIYTCRNVDDTLGNVFVPRSTLAAMRRDVIDALDDTAAATYRSERRRPAVPAADNPDGATVTYHRNVANSLARRFYAEHGATRIDSAAEVSRPGGETVVMTTRYCLRRELDACLMGRNASRLPRELYLQAPAARMRVDCDCRNCEMRLILCKE